jgi:hypothetical protein
MLGLSSLKCKNSKNFFKPQKVGHTAKAVHEMAAGSDNLHASDARDV